MAMYYEVAVTLPSMATHRTRPQGSFEPCFLLGARLWAPRLQASMALWLWLWLSPSPQPGRRAPPRGRSPLLASARPRLSWTLTTTQPAPLHRRGLDLLLPPGPCRAGDAGIRRPETHESPFLSDPYDSEKLRIEGELLKLQIRISGCSDVVCSPLSGLHAFLTPSCLVRVSSALPVGCLTKHPQRGNQKLRLFASPFVFLHRPVAAAAAEYKKGSQFAVLAALAA